MTTIKNNDDNSFTIRSITYEISNKEKREVVITTMPGFLGKHTSYGGSKRCKLETEEVKIPAYIEYKGIHYTVTGVLNSVFDECDKVKRIVFPATINRIKWSFWKCFALEAFEVASDNSYYCDVDGVLYNKDKTKLIAYPNNKGKRYEVLESVEVLRHFCFKSCNIEEIVLHDNVRSIESNVFYQCTNLKRVVLPNKLKEMKNQDRVPTFTKFNYKGKDYSYKELKKLFSFLSIIK